jgi:hypothetical protein
LDVNHADPFQILPLPRFCVGVVLSSSRLQSHSSWNCPAKNNSSGALMFIQVQNCTHPSSLIL